MQSSFLVVATLAICASSVAGQAMGPGAPATPVTAVAAQPCTYDACALRLYGEYLMRGTQREVAGTMRAALAPVFLPSDSAVRWARIYDGERSRGRALTRAGLMGMNAGLVLVGVAAARPGQGWAYPAVALALGGGWALGCGTAHRGRANAALNQAVWWYNRDVAAGRIPQ